MNSIQCNIINNKIKKAMLNSMNKSEKEGREYLHGICQSKNGDTYLSNIIGKSNSQSDAGIGFTAQSLKKACKKGKPIGDFHTHPFVHSKENLGEDAKDVYVSGGDIIHLDTLSRDLKTNFTGCIGGKVLKNKVKVNRVRCFTNNTIQPFVRKTAHKMNGIKKKRIGRKDYENAAQETAYVLDEQNMGDDYSCRNDY